MALRLTSTVFRSPRCVTDACNRHERKDFRTNAEDRRMARLERRISVSWNAGRRRRNQAEHVRLELHLYC